MPGTEAGHDENQANATAERAAPSPSLSIRS